MLLGLTRPPWTWQRVLGKRLFPAHLSLPEGWQRLYRRQWTTAELGNNSRHSLRHAF